LVAWILQTDASTTTNTTDISGAQSDATQGIATGTAAFALAESLRSAISDLLHLPRPDFRPCPDFYSPTQVYSKADIGLQKVENTALSTWAGSTNLTTLGTITTGVWNGGAVASTGTVTGTNLSGTNTGDQTITLMGDVTGSGTGSFATTLAAVNANVGTFGSSTSIPTFTVNAKGLITAASGNAVVAPAGTLTGTTLAAGVAASSLTSVGTLTSGIWNAGAVTSSGAVTGTSFIPTSATVPTNGINLPAANSIGFNTNSTDVGRINASGYLVMGATAPTSSRSHTMRTAATGVYCLAAEHTHASNPLGQSILYTAAAPNDTTHLFLDCGDTGAQRAAIRSNGGLANFSANNVNLSDGRLKTAIAPAHSYWDKVKALEVVTYLYKDQTDTELNLGVIAQQVDSVAPELIDHSGYGTAPEGEAHYLAVYQTDMQYALLKALQEAQSRIEKLEALLADAK
jgi:hypothetical protein